MLTTFISLGALGLTTIGGALLEKHLVKNDRICSSKTCKRWNISWNKDRWSLFHWLCIHSNCGDVLRRKLHGDFKELAS